MAKHISRKRSLSRSALYSEVVEQLKANGYESVKRNLVRDCVKSFVNVILGNSVANRGVAVPGLGKITWKHRQAREAGTVQRFGLEMTVKARPESWVPKFRFQRAAKLALLAAVR